jgi:hypothetical protein
MILLALEERGVMPERARGRDAGEKIFESPEESAWGVGFGGG